MTSVRQSLSLSFASKYCSLAIQFGSSLVLARLLTPEEIGIFSVGVAITSFAQILRDFGVTNYLIQEKQLTTDRIRAALALTCIVAWSMAIVLALLAGPAAGFYKEPGLKEVLYVLACSFLILPLSSTILAVLRREMRFGALFKINLIGSIAHVATGIGLAYSGFGYMSLAWASLTGILFTALIAMLYHRAPAHYIPGVREIRRVLSFGAIASAANFLQEVQDSAPDLIVGRLIDFRSVGLLSRADGLNSMYSRLVIQAILPVVLPSLADRHRRGEDLAEPCLTAMSYMAALAWPFSLYLVLTARPLVVFLFGDQWAPVGPLLEIIALSTLFICVRPVCESALTACGRIDLKLRVVMLTAPMIVGLILIGALHSLAAVAYAILFGSIVQAALVFAYTRTVVSLSVRAFSLAIAHVSLLAAISFCCGSVVLWACRELAAPRVIILTLVAAAMGLSWLCAVLVTKHPISRELALARAYVVGRMLGQRDS